MIYCADCWALPWKQWTSLLPKKLPITCSKREPSLSPDSIWLRWTSNELAITASDLTTITAPSVIWNEPGRGKICRAKSRQKSSLVWGRRMSTSTTLTSSPADWPRHLCTAASSVQLSLVLLLCNSVSCGNAIVSGQKVDYHFSNGNFFTILHFKIGTKTAIHWSASLRPNWLRSAKPRRPSWFVITLTELILHNVQLSIKANHFCKFLYLYFLHIIHSNYILFKNRNPRVSCRSLPSIDLELWKERVSCTVGSTNIEVGKADRISPCVMCTCTREGVSYRSYETDIWWNYINVIYFTAHLPVTEGGQLLPTGPDFQPGCNSERPRLQGAVRFRFPSLPASRRRRRSQSARLQLNAPDQKHDKKIHLKQSSTILEEEVSSIMF